MQYEDATSVMLSVLLSEESKCPCPEKFYDNGIASIRSEVLSWVSLATLHVYFVMFSSVAVGEHLLMSSRTYHVLTPVTMHNVQPCK